jgi:2-polyprenyl-6-methoxyphenol hydroxylase-like FAD-dependent oxidoreductase
MAIEDALVLAACVEAENHYETAFDRYEALRRDRINHVVKLTARNSSQKRTSSWLGLLIRDFILPLVIPLGVRQGGKLLQFRGLFTPAQPRYC